jgi:hypothetical protein
VNVRNVAQTVIRQAYAIYGFDAGGRREPARAGQDSRDGQGSREGRGSRDAASTAPATER